jgi:hypothetical protein
MTHTRFRIPFLGALATTAALAVAPIASGAITGDADGGYTGLPPGIAPAVSGIFGLDKVAPVLKSGIATRHLRTLRRTGTLRVTSAINERGGVAMIGALQGLKARPGKKLSKKVYVTPLFVKAYPAAGNGTFVLVFPAKALKALRNMRKVSVSVLVAADDAVKNRSKAVLTRTLK